jgi:hypothetical protein
MARKRIDEAEYRRIADKYGLDASDVRRAVQCFFDVILRESAGLPFDNPRRIYSKEKFQEYAKTRNLPYLGRIGPVYSRYLKWRANESQTMEMAPRSSFRRGITQSEIESTAAAILSGQTPPPINRRKNSELFDRVWLVGQDGKKSARQVIPKKEK